MSIKFIVVTLSLYGHIMIVTPFEYAKLFPSKGKVLSAKTIVRRCEDGLLPSDHHAKQLMNETGTKGQWIIEVPDKETPKIVPTKLNPAKPDIQTLNRKHFNFN